MHFVSAVSHCIRNFRALDASVTRKLGHALGKLGCRYRLKFSEHLMVLHFYKVLYQN